VASEVSGRDLTLFEDQLFKSPEGLDDAVKELKCHEDEGESECYVTVERRDPTVVSVRLLVTFDDGTKTTEAWDGKERWHRFWFRRKGKGGAVKEAQVDPEGQWQTDANMLNNARSRENDVRAEGALMGWLTYVGQLLAVGTGGLF
jgi:hypothetical protein